MIGLAVGAAAAPVLISLFDAAGALLAAGGLLGAVAILAWPRLRRVDGLVDAPGPAFELLRRVSIFTPLPAYVQERLARHLVPVRVPAGGVVIREGEIGDRFYVVDEGSVAVTKSGVLVAELGRGDYFGEIALLRDVPRTATVTAIDDVELAALERDVFLEAVTGSMPSRSQADEEIDRRMGEGTE